MVKAIVVGYDGTRAAEDALKRAADFARVFGARVVVVDVAAPAPVTAVPGPGAFGLAPYHGYTTEDVGERLARDDESWQRHQERVQEVLADAGIDGEFARVAGDPADQLVAAAEERGAELIVVGTREPGFLERLLTGSVSQSVARHARCDVLIVHSRARDGEREQ